MATQKEKDFAALLERAREAAQKAGSAVNPNPMIVQDADVLSGAPIPGGKEYFVADGVCGFAWVNVRPGGCSFAKYLKKVCAARPSYHGGVDIYVHSFNQSLERKEAAAYAMARVLSEAGIQAYAGSRMD